MDLVDYNIFINLHLNRKLNNFAKYRQFVIIFALLKTATFPHYKEITFCLGNNLIDDYCLN